MELLQLKYFQTVAYTEHISKANKTIEYRSTLPELND